MQAGAVKDKGGPVRLAAYRAGLMFSRSLKMGRSASVVVCGLAGIGQFTKNPVTRSLAKCAKDAEREGPGLPPQGAPDSRTLLSRPNDLRCSFFSGFTLILSAFVHSSHSFQDAIQIGTDRHRHSIILLHSCRSDPLQRPCVQDPPFA